MFEFKEYDIKIYKAVENYTVSNFLLYSFNKLLGFSLKETHSV